MKRKLIPIWVLGFAMLAGVSASAQQSTHTDVSKAAAVSVPKPAGEQAKVKKTQNAPVRAVVDIEADIKDVKMKIQAKQKLAGYDTKPFEERLAKLEEELRQAKAVQK